MRFVFRKNNDNDMEMEQRARSVGVRASAFSLGIFEMRPAGAAAIGNSESIHGRSGSIGGSERSSIRSKSGATQSGIP